MTPLEKINAMKMPFAELKGVNFTEAEKDRVVARMLVRPELCTLSHTIHGGALMAFADLVGAAATVINLPEDAKGTTTIESKTNFIGGAKEGMTVIAIATPVHRGRRTQVGRRGWRQRRETRGPRHANPDGALSGTFLRCVIESLARNRGFLPQFQAVTRLEFHGAAHNISDLGI